MGGGVYLVVLLSCIGVGACYGTSGGAALDACRPLVVAHRGASGYVPEHTLGAYALAVTMGTDYVEPDLVMTKDGHLIARHENQLSLTTDVAERTEFASRRQTKQVNGRTHTDWFSEDFTLAEIKTLRSRELLSLARPGNTRMNDAFEIPTMQEIIDLVKGMQLSEQRVIGIYPEIKNGLYFQRLGLAMEKPLVDLLHDNGYSGANAPVYIQSFEVSNLKELRNLTDMKLIQLYGGGQPYDQAELGTGVTYLAMATREGLLEVATYADAVGPDRSYVIPRNSANNLGTPTNFVADAHAAGLLVHPYTFRAENSYLPVEFRSNETGAAAIGDMRGEVEVFLAAGIDGLFTDQPDLPLRMRGRCVAPLPSSSPNISVHPLLCLILLAEILLR